MKITADRRDMAEAAKIAFAATPRVKAYAAPLYDVQLDTRHGREITLTATDGTDIVAVTTVPATIHDSDGPARVPARTLVDAIAATTGDTVTLAAETDRMIVEGSESGRATIALSPATDDTPAPTAPDTMAMIAGDTLAAALTNTLTAASTDQARPTLCGVQITRATDGTATLTATDSYRLHIQTVSGLLLPDTWEPVIIPRDQLRVMLAGHPKQKGAHTIGATAGRVHVDDGRTHWAIRPVPGNYPNMDSVLPHDRDIRLHATLRPGDMIDALAPIVKATPKGKNTKAVPVRLTMHHDHIDLAWAHAGNAIEATVPAQVTTDGAGTRQQADGEADELTERAYDPTYLRDAIAAHKTSPTATITWTGPLRPVKITTEHTLTLLMPIRITDRQ